jgi:hypothetical protein
MSASPERMKPIIAVTELLLIFPAVLFMTALFVRNLQPTRYQPARSAQLIVQWFSARPNLGLSVLMIACPTAVLVIGAVTLRRSWRADRELRDAAHQAWTVLRRHWTPFIVAATTLAAAGILAIVALHVLSG